MTAITPFTAFWWGVLHAIGLFDTRELPFDVLAAPENYPAWFGAGEACMAAVMAAGIAIPAGCWFATRTGLPLAFIGMAVVFLPLFVFLPRLIQYAVTADIGTVLAVFGRNEQMRRVFWALFAGMAGLALAQVVDPVTAQKIAGIIAGLLP